MGNQHSHSDHHRRSSELEVDSAGLATSSTVRQGSKNPACLTKLFEVIYFDHVQIVFFKSSVLTFVLITQN